MKIIAAGIASIIAIVSGVGVALSLSTASTPAGKNLDQAWSLEQQFTFHKKWVKQNPKESAKLSDYWVNGGTPPNLATYHGQAWVLVKTAQLQIESTTTTTVPATTTEPPTTTTEPPPPPSDSNTANIWIDSNGGSCARSVALVSYSDDAACSSFAVAYALASSGDVIGVTGTLGEQFFAGDWRGTQSPGTKRLTFTGVSGNKVRQLVFGSPNLTFDGINVDANGVQTSGAAFENGGDPFVFKNGSIGNVVDEKGALVTGSGIVFDNVNFHDVVLRTAGVHNECIWAGVPEGMILRNSTFTNCATMDIFFTYPDYWNPLPDPYGNVTMENNTFGVPRDLGGDDPLGYSIYIAKNGVSLSNQTPMSGWRIKNNFVEPGSYGVNSDQPLGSNNIFCGNTGNVPTSWKTSC